MKLRNFIPPPFIAIVVAGFAAVYLDDDERGLKSMPEPIASEFATDNGVATAVTGNDDDFVASPSTFGDDELVAIAERPLFSETRRKPEIKPKLVLPLEPAEDEFVEIEIEEPELEKKQPEAEPPIPPDFTYQGFVRSGENLIALVQNKQTSREKWVKIGDPLDGWTVTKVSEKQIEFDRAGFAHIAAINQ